MLSSITLSALVLTGMSAAPAGDQGSTCSTTKAVAVANKKDIVETAVAAGSFKTLATALGAADLVGALQGEGPFTVFAPTDEAFANLPKGVLDNLLKPENRGQLTNILTYHVVAGRVAAKDVIELSNATTLNGQRAPIATSDAGVRVAGAQVVTTDIECRNGIIHVIDQVMLPNMETVVGTAKKAGTFETLVAAVGAAELVETLSGEGPFTVFAPTDAAFAALPEGTVESLLKPENKDQLVKILTYHVVPGRVYSDQLADGKVRSLQGQALKIKVGDGVRINSAKVVRADLDTTNGVIHVVNQVILPE